MTSKNDLTLNQKFGHYLMSSYLYYVEDVHILADTQYDYLCKELLDNWDSITHPHKTLISREDLEAGTGFSIEYPTIVIGAARHWYREHAKPTKTKRRKNG